MPFKKDERKVSTGGGVFLRYFTFFILGISLIAVLLHFIFFQVRYPAQIGAVITDIVILAIIVSILFETYHLSRLWRGPFIWINVGIFFFFMGFLLELLGEFFVKPGFMRYSIENGPKLLAFGILAWGFFQWGKEKFEVSRKVETLKEIDGPTGLPNRSSFNQELERRERIARRYGELFSLIYLNIDNFRRYNEDAGEILGDALLKKMAELISQNVRGGDISFRYGGDEFMALLPGVKGEISEKIASRLRAKVEDEFKKEGITTSLAVASYEQDKNIIKRLEEAMLMAKTAGKNRVYKAD